MPVGFEPGRLIVHRNVRHACIGWVRPVRVVRDDEDGLLLWLASGTAVGYEVAVGGGDLRTMPLADWTARAHRMATGVWSGFGTLMYLPRGAAHSIWWLRAADGTFTGWYVNLEEPAVRWRDPRIAGVDIVDQDLDLLIGPDLVGHWKDEEEFEQRLRSGARYWVADGEAVRAEGRRVMAAAATGRFPFDGTWCDFTPPEHWETPKALPEGCLRPVRR